MGKSKLTNEQMTNEILSRLKKIKEIVDNVSIPDDDYCDEDAKDMKNALEDILILSNLNSIGIKPLTSEGVAIKHDANYSVCGTSEIGEWCYPCDFNKECDLFLK